MHFCMVTTFYPPFNFGGDGIFVQQLSNELAKRGHQVEVVHSPDVYHILAGGGQSAAGTDHPNVTVHRLRSRFSFLSALATQQTGFPFFMSTRLKTILGSRFDVIHYHNISLIGGPKILHYGQGIKLYTLHEYWLLCPTHLLFRYNRKPCTRPQCFTCTLAHKRPPQWWRYSGMIRDAAQQVDAFIAPSQFTNQKHLEMGLEVPIVELPYFTARWQHEELPDRGTHRELPYFLFVGRLEKVKGLQTLLPIFRRYQKARLLVVGTGSYESALRRMAAGSAHITFLGYQTGAQLRQLYQQAVAVIVPSIWYEVFGQVIIEAFALKTPVIVRNIGGMPALIEESGGGFVYDTAAQLVEALDRLLGEADLRQTLGQRGYEAFRQRWVADVHIPRYLDLISELAAARSRAVSGRPLDGMDAAMS